MSWIKCAVHFALIVSVLPQIQALRCAFAAFNKKLSFIHRCWFVRTNICMHTSAKF